MRGNALQAQSLREAHSIVAIVALGRDAVALTSGLNTLALDDRVVRHSLRRAASGPDAALICAVPAVAALDLSAIMMTLAMSGMLQGAALVSSRGTPSGFASPALRWLTAARVGA